MRAWWIATSLLGGCLFNGAETEGLPCNNNGECGVGIDCIERVCGGPTIVDTDTDGDTDTDTDGETDEASDESDASADDDSVREMCVPEDTVCLDGDTLRQCSDDGKLATIGCPGVCGENLETIGCHHIPADDVDNCVCTFEVEPCTSEGAYRCNGDDQDQCVDGKQKHFDCDRVCVEAGYVGADYCSDGTCYCNASTCTEAAQRCTDSNTIAGCWGGTWYPESCTQICQDNGYTVSMGCFVYPGDDSGCMCF